MQSDSCLVLQLSSAVETQGMTPGASKKRSFEKDRKNNTRQHGVSRDLPQPLSSAEIVPEVSAGRRPATVVSDVSTSTARVDSSESEKSGAISPAALDLKLPRINDSGNDISNYSVDDSHDGSSSDDDSETDESAASMPQHEKLLAQTESVTLRSVDRTTRVLLVRLMETCRLGRLTVINFTRRGLTAKEAPLIRDAIIGSPQLSVLKLSYNDLGDDGVAMISSAILHKGSHHKFLSALDLGFNSIGDLGCGAVALQCLAGNPAINTLYLSGNCIRAKGALSIAGAILHGTGLETLHLSANSITSAGVKAIAAAIATVEARKSRDMLPDVGGIKNLFLSGVSMDTSGFMTIPGMLMTNRTLRSLCLTNNGLDDRDMQLLAHALTQNKQFPLESLQLSFNNITCEGTEHLMNAVWGSTTLREIKLDNNRLKDRGAQLCAVVLTSVALNSLDIGFNRITTVGIKALMKNASENDSLQTLGLCGIQIDQNASKAVSYALAYNTSLRVLYLDNCSTGYATQRHIVAGIISNQRTSLRVLTGFQIGPIAMTLGLPRLPDSWANDQVLGFVRFMWQQWLLKAGRGAMSPSEATRGPAPPAAVAAAAKIAFSSLGNNPEPLFHTEAHELPVAERAPVEPTSTSLLERTSSGTICVPTFSDALLGSSFDLNSESSNSSDALTSTATVLSIAQILENPERRNKNLHWLRQHFTSLSDIGRLPYNDADHWQLHQYYFSPPLSDFKNLAENSTLAKDYDSACAPPFTPSLSSEVASSPLGRAISFQRLEHALRAVAPLGSTHKRRSSIIGGSEEGGPANKRAKSLKPRINYYPRIMSKIQSLDTKPPEQTLGILRQLKYAENVMFAGNDPYVESDEDSAESKIRADIEMILVDLI